MENTKEHIIDTEALERLFRSFAELDHAIRRAKGCLSRRSVIPFELMQRFDSYEEILHEQRTLAHELFRHLRNRDWNEVKRLVELLNGLSGMIREDAEEILDALTPSAERETKRVVNFC